MVAMTRRDTVKKVLTLLFDELGVHPYNQVIRDWYINLINVSRKVLYLSNHCMRRQEDLFAKHKEQN